MKRVLALALVVVVVLAVAFTGCSAATYKTGYGVVTSVAKSASATVKDGADVKGLAETDSYIAVVTLDSKGKFVTVKFDSIQTKVNFDKAGAVTTDLTKEQLTKQEKKEAYGMQKASSIGAEWYTQANDFAAWMIGKTYDEVKTLKTKTVGTHDGVPDNADLSSKVTIGVSEMMEALEKAVANAQ